MHSYDSCLQQEVSQTFGRASVPQWEYYILPCCLLSNHHQMALKKGKSTSTLTIDLSFNPRAHKSSSVRFSVFLISCTQTTSTDYTSNNLRGGTAENHQHVVSLEETTAHDVI